MDVPKQARRWPALILLMVVCWPAVSPAADAVLTLAQAEKISLRQNPALAAAGRHAAAMGDIPAQAGSLPDPVLSLNAMNLPVNTLSTTQEAMTQMQLGLSQAIPFPGKLSLKAEAARHEAAAAARQTDEASLGLIRNVRLHWWNLVYLDRALEILDSNRKLLRQFIHVAEVKYQVGKGLQQDVLLAQLELSRLTDNGIALQAARQREQAALDALLDRPANMPIVVPKKVDERLPVPPDEDGLIREALASRPLLARESSAIGAADARVRLAEKGYDPDFKLGAAYGFRQGSAGGQARPDLFSVSLSMTLPWFTGGKQDAALAESRAVLARAQFRREDATQAVRAEVVQALADYRQAREQASLYKTGIVPQASQTVASMMAGYQVNKVDFLNLIRAQITLYNYETQYWKALTSARQDLARLTAAVGKEITHE